MGEDYLHIDQLSHAVVGHAWETLLRSHLAAPANVLNRFHNRVKNPAHRTLVHIHFITPYTILWAGGYLVPLTVGIYSYGFAPVPVPTYGEKNEKRE